MTTVKRTHSANLAQADRQLLWFQLLSAEEQAACIHRLADQGRDDHAIASITRLDLATVRRIIARREL